MDAPGYFKGKKITVMGLGLLGGLGDIRYLAEQDADLILTDLKSPDELQPSLDALKDFSNIRYTLGEHKLGDFQGRDLVIKAPSTPPDSPYILEARKEGTPVAMWAGLFARFAREAGATVVGITGTRGKTTTTALIAEAASAAGRQVITGGNVPGTSVLPHLPELTKDSLVVLELDSWKIQGFAEEKISPTVGVFTTFYPDHLNYYRGDLDAYLADKANIFLYQKAGDVLVLGAQCAELVQKKYGGQIKSKIVIADAGDLPSDWRLKIPGEHNRYDAACALAALRAVGVADEASKNAFQNFKGVPGRLELVREVKGVKFYNDTTATTPEATLAALKALASDEPKTVLIMGGADKQLDMRPLIEEIPIYAKSVVMLTGTGTSLIAPSLADAPIYDNLKDAVAEAMRRASPGDSVLLSPALASFGMFKNEYDRGDQFNAIVRAL